MDERYTIREIASLTGLPAATLRKWEERYGIVQPVRQANGYRTYSASDLAALRWLKAKVDGGALVSTAAEELRARMAAGWTPAEEDLPPAAPANSPAAFREQLVTGLLQRSPARISLALDSAFAFYDVETVVCQVIQGALYKLGDLWEALEISPYQEHYGTVLLRDRLIALRALLGRSSGPLILASCVPGEQHELGSICFGLLAARRGYQVIHLGASPAPHGLKQAVQDLQPTVLALSVACAGLLEESRPWLREMAAAAPPGTVLLLGGLGVKGQGIPLEGFTPLFMDADRALDELERIRRRP